MGEIGIAEGEIGLTFIPDCEVLRLSLAAIFEDGPRPGGGRGYMVALFQTVVCAAVFSYFGSIMTHSTLGAAAGGVVGVVISIVALVVL
jgi:hypothetical protein